MTRRRIPADFLLVTGLLLVAVAGALWALRSTVTASTRLTEQSRAILAQDAVRDAFAQRLADVLEPPLPETPPDAAAAARQVADRAVREPEFAEAFTRALPQVHAYVFDDGTGPLVLDETLVGQAVRAAGGRPPDGASRVTLTIDTDMLPSLAESSRRAQVAVPLLALAGAFLAVAGFATSDHRARAVMRIGRWMLVSGLLAVAVFWLLPTLVLRPTGGWLAVGGIVLATGDGLLWPAGLLAFGGALAIVAGHAWDGRDRDRVLRVIPRAPGRHPDSTAPWRSPV